ncbi:Co2+/Mg2+ efflux protein ApaG [Oecophyllibacter saccharovorans]|uniref:Co2+/Mg2+ efflux protein ApaG n=1 Tax=Oecophyllibacter saccharovorans TaxID=2558360 RepID=A0A506UM74_9PROT|nr:Co2+/Mg2+ efflux protein ApaG [Oecophyllibacter saccharovorans]QDH15497.1 Co2+/Mg2+ efflux protein ApaG [Oecophyllibacter saccharovorans]TPW34332.1 Co2+/Mg2+ efflux protein ApaG [Oecophyllibacter saccharovorans]TPW36518.1 Co2+/Mg2+ efflux protein ApaG [Oecophyllibacter saccharovorans]
MSEKSFPSLFEFEDLDTTDIDLPELSFCFVETTGDIRVSVRTFWLEDQSSLEERRHQWLYHVTIENDGDESVQILGRDWTIVDGQGGVRHVYGEGVVDEQPVIRPRDSFEYTSGTELPTPTGIMHGQFHMLLPGSGECFKVDIPVFSLDSPHHGGMVH